MLLETHIISGMDIGQSREEKIISLQQLMSCLLKAKRFSH